MTAAKRAEASKDRRDEERTATVAPVPIPDDQDTRELSRVTGTTQVDPEGMAGKRRRGLPAVQKLKTKPTPVSTLKWTGANVDQMVEFCGPDPLGNPAANFSRFWQGDFELTVYDRSQETAHAVKRGERVVRADQHADGGWGVLHPASDDELDAAYQAA